MIAKDQMFPILLAACPSFQPTWQEFLRAWEGDADPPQYVALSAFARHIIAMLARGDTSAFPASFAAIERFVLEGDSYVAEAATVGLLEALQNTNLHATTDPEQLRPFLGPACRIAWEQLYGFWEHVHEWRILELFRTLDDPRPQYTEHPPGFNSDEAESRFAAFVASLEHELGQALRVETGADIQDASFHSQIDVPRSWCRPTDAQPTVRFSNFGNMVTVLDQDAVDPARLSWLLPRLEAAGYVYVPEAFVNLHYTGQNSGVDGIRDWRIRFFDWI